MTYAKLFVNDVEELSYSVAPWEFCMGQLTPGNFRGCMQIAKVTDLFVSHEFWSRKIVGNGQTPPGYAVIAGAVGSVAFSWCGEKTTSNRVAFAPGCREVDFLALDEEQHWTLLIPQQALLEHLGEESVEQIPTSAVSFEVAESHARWIAHTVLDVIRICGSINIRQDNSLIETTSRQRLMAIATQLLLNRTEYQTDKGHISASLLAYIRARQYFDESLQPVSTAALARRVGVCRRTLEQGFKAATGVSPQTFMRQTRLNALHRELMLASPESATVTRTAQRFGITELGRYSGYYRHLFGESPSETLNKNFEQSGLRFSDVLLH